MKKTFLVMAAAMSLCLPVYAEQTDPFDSKHAADYPVFEGEQQDQELANLGMFTPSTTGRVRKNELKPVITDPKDPDYVPPVEDKSKSKKKKDAAPTGPIPVHLSGDHVEFENATGDFLANGKVVIKQGPETLLTNNAFGNMKTGDIYLLEGGTLLEPGNRTEGKWVHYNFNSKTGEIKQVSGRGERDWFKAPHALVLPDKLIADQGGETTRCFAKEHVPCMSVKAKTLEFYPKEKMVAHDVKVYMKGKHIYSRKLWINEFSKENKTIIKPSVGWNGGTNGFYAKLEMQQPLTEKDSIHITLPKYSRSDFKPAISVSHYEKNWSLNYFTGWDEDDDYWYLKQNNWKLKYKPHRIVKGLPLSFSADFEYGLWRKWNPDNDKTQYRRFRGRVGSESWHREYKYYINHDPIKLFGPDTTLHLTYGRKWVHESFTKETQITNMYYATIRQKVTKQFDLWASYLYQKKTSSLFDLGQPDMDKELRVGFQLRPSRNDVFSVVHRYDLSDRETIARAHHGIGTRKYATTYNWYHRFCCWALQLTYEAKWYKDKRKLAVQYFLYNW